MIIRIEYSKTVLKVPSEQLYIWNGYVRTKLWMWITRNLHLKQLNFSKLLFFLDVINPLAKIMKTTPYNAHNALNHCLRKLNYKVLSIENPCHLHSEWPVYEQQRWADEFILVWLYFCGLTGWLYLTNWLSTHDCCTRMNGLLNLLEG